MPVVTALRERPRSRVEVELDGAPWRLVPTDAVVRAGLRVGAPLDRETGASARPRASARQGARRRGERAPLPRPFAAVARTAPRRSRRPGGAAADALAALESAGLVDDLRVASTRAESLADRGYGDAAIRADLEQRGIDAELVATALAALAPEPERARAVVERRGVGPQDRPLARGPRLRPVRGGGVPRRAVCSGRVTAVRSEDTLHPTFCLHTDFFGNCDVLRIDIRPTTKRSTERIAPG